MRRFVGVAAAAGSVGAVPTQRGGGATRARGHDAGPVRDLRGPGVRGPQRLRFAQGDIVVVSGLPGGGKSTLIKRAAAEGGSEGGAIDSQDTRERWERRMPGALPYAVYRPLVRAAHYWGLWRTLRSGRSVVVHDCGTQSWVRALLAAVARRRGRALHLLLLDSSPEEALSGQAARGRRVSAYAFARHRGAVNRLLREAEAGRPPAGCASATLLDRRSAAAVARIAFHD
ncbi:ATP-binding protein [Streptomyces sp. NBC_01351]|uniref:AAA family ATPase n=1 Tax=Streptomyces sp. NBC_01351 TaxID=2903833 RepID=UPI002E374C03|nr:AAA family ATPase [Streptomyces sp. NBC_01351]